MIVNNGVVMARDVYVNFRMHGPGGKGFWSLQEQQSGWQLTESIGGWHVVADDRFRLAPSACISALSPMVYLKPPFNRDLWYEITLGCSGSPVQMFERRVPHANIDEAYRRFMASDRGKQAGFILSQLIFGIGEDQDIKNAD